MTEYIPVQIVQKTTNGYIVQDSTGREAWVGERYLHDDGTVGKALFERRVAEKIAQDKAIEEAPNREFLKGYHPCAIEKETDSAIAVMARWTGPSGQGGRHWVWFSKKMLQEGKIPGHLIESKAHEVRQKLWGLIGSASVAIQVEIAGFEFMPD